MSVPVVYVGAERAFRLADLATGTEHVTGSMPTGPWLADRHGTPLLGALGVLVDDVLGYSLVRARPDRLWSVSSEITVDLLRPLRLDAGPLHATTVGEQRFDELGGQVAGTVAAADGTVVTVCAQRGRWVPFDGEFAVRDAPPVDLSGATCVEDLLGGEPESVEGGSRLRLAVGPVLANPLGNLHGGLSLCATDLAASAAVTTWDTPWSTESIRIQYLRPAPAGATVEFRAVVRHTGRTRALVEVAGLVGDRLCTAAHVVGRPFT